MRLMYVHAIDDMIYSERAEKYLVRAQLVGWPASRFWLSPKQAAKLLSLLERSKSGYSCKRFSIYALLDGNRWIACGGHSNHKSEIPWLADRFGATLPDEIASWVEATTPKPAEAIHDLVDE